MEEIHEGVSQSKTRMSQQHEVAASQMNSLQHHVQNAECSLLCEQLPPALEFSILLPHHTSRGPYVNKSGSTGEMIKQLDSWRL